MIHSGNSYLFSRNNVLCFCVEISSLHRLPINTYWRFITSMATFSANGFANLKALFSTSTITKSLSTRKLRVFLYWQVQQYPAATNVHSLRPNDIRVIASFGDSITAGNGLGAGTAPGVGIENRGESWSVGGNQTIATMLTVPNLIKQFNADVTGWSWSRCVPTRIHTTYTGALLAGRGTSYACIY